MRRVPLAVILVLLASQAGIAQVTPPEPRLDVALRALGTPSSEAPLDLVVSVRALLNSPQTRVSVGLGDGVVLLAGDTAFTVSLSAGQQIEHAVRVRFDRPGRYRVFARAADESPLASEAPVSNHGVAGLYLAVGRSQGRVVESADQLVPPGMRALTRVLGVDTATIRPVDLRPGEVRYFTRPGLAGSHRNLAAAIKEIQDAGADALSEDSAAQVGRLISALARDRAQGGAGAGMQPGAAAALALLSDVAAMSTSCPAGYVLRSGSLSYDNPNTTATTDYLPQIYIEAASAPHGFPANVTAWYTRADGTFNACVPYDVNGYTFITIYQYNGYTELRREGISSSTPRNVFPNGWDQVWDLTRSSSLPLRANHDEAAGILATLYRSVSYANQIFSYQRGPVVVWYWEKPEDANINYYCSAGFPINPFSGCTNSGEGIYLHRYYKSGSTLIEQIWTPYAQFGFAHEYGHAWDQAILGDIGGSCSGSHSIGAPNTVGCAVKEGWADFFSVLTLRPELGFYPSNPETLRYGGPQGPQIEGTFMTYLWDLVDSGSFPAHRPLGADDDGFALSPDHVARVLRDGRTNNGRTRTIAEFIAILDNVTPVPYKPEFAAYAQPTSLSVRVTPPAGFTPSANATLWRREIFGTVSPSFTVTASAPFFVTVKAYYDLIGSASEPVSTWEWSRSDDDGASWYTWDNVQNSRFIAYAGSYTIDWRLMARRSFDGATAYDYDRTTVCIGTTGCGIPPAIAGLGSAAENAAPLSLQQGRTELVAMPTTVRAVPTTAAAGHAGDHFGAGAWVGGRTASGPRVALLYSPAGGHHARGDEWPNFLAGPIQSAQESGVGRLPARVTFVRRNDSAGRESYRIQVAGRTAPIAEGYVALALDPDLGARPEDDSLGVDAETGLVWVVDAEGGAIGYLLHGAPGGAAPVVRQFSTLQSTWRPDPTSEAAAYAELSAGKTVLTGRRDDVRFILVVGPTALDAKPLELQLTVLRASSLAELRAQATESAPPMIVAQTSVSPGEAAPSEFRLVQAPPAPGVGRGVERISAATVPALTDAASPPESGAEMARLVREEGITALAFTVPEGQSARVRIRIFDPAGRLVRTLLDEAKDPGAYRIQWDELTERGGRAAPGVYIAVMDAPGFRATRKLVVVP